MTSFASASFVITKTACCATEPSSCAAAYPAIASPPIRAAPIMVTCAVFIANPPNRKKGYDTFRTIAAPDRVVTSAANPNPRLALLERARHESPFAPVSYLPRCRSEVESFPYESHRCNELPLCNDETEGGSWIRSATKPGGQRCWNWHWTVTPRLIRTSFRGWPQL